MENLDTLHKTENNSPIEEEVSLKPIPGTENEAEFEKYLTLSPEQKKYVDTVKKLEEVAIKKQKQYAEDRGFINVNDKKINIEEISQNQEYLNNLDFNLKVNQENLDLLINKLPAEKIYTKLFENNLSKEKAIEIVDNLPLESRKKFIASLSPSYRQNLADKYQESVGKNITNPNPSVSFQYALRSINLPLVEKMKNSKEDYFNELRKSKADFLNYFQKEMNEYGPYAVSKVFKETDLRLLFSASQFNFIPKEKAIEMTEEVIKKYGEMNKPEMQAKIIEGILDLNQSGVLSKSETDKILSMDQLLSTK